MNEKTIGYARTSSSEQDIGSQVEMLKGAGCSVVYTDCGVPGPGLKEARANLQPGDKLKVLRIDRIARSVSAADTFVTDLFRNHIEFEAVGEPDAAMVIRLRDTLNYGFAISIETPLWRKLAYRLGSFLIQFSGRGVVPPR